MFLLKDKIRQVMTKKHLDKNMAGVVALNAIRHYFGFTHNTLLIDGYIKFDKLFLKTTQQHIKIKIFQEKATLLAVVNNSLHEVGFAITIKEMFFK